MKTNAVRRLEALGVAHETVEYEVDEEALDAVSVARKIGADADGVFKTLVARGDKTGVVVFCIPGPAELHLKKAAAVSGNKSLEMVKAKELLPLTGYIRGGCSPVGMKKEYPTYIDETAHPRECGRARHAASDRSRRSPARRGRHLRRRHLKTDQAQCGSTAPDEHGAGWISARARAGCGR